MADLGDGIEEIVQNIDVEVIETRNQQIEASLENVNKEITIQLIAIQKQLDDANTRNRKNKVDTKISQEAIEQGKAMFPNHEGYFSVSVYDIESIM